MQSEVFTARQLYEAMMGSCGGQITSGYLQLKEMPISEVLYDINICISIQQTINKQNNKSGINIPTDMEWEEIK